MGGRPIAEVPSRVVAPAPGGAIFTAIVRQEPAPMETPPLRPDTRTGNQRRVIVPSPSWPESLLPQPQTVPSLFTTSVKSIHRLQSGDLVVAARAGD